jgi:hypothetical protein
LAEPNVKNYSALYGKDAANHYVSAVYNQLPQSVRTPAAADAYAQLEIKKGAAAEEHVAGLGQQLLNRQLGLQNQHILDPASYGASEADDPMTKAAKWINSASTSSKAPPEETKSMLEDLRREGVPYDSMEGMQEINSRITNLGKGGKAPAEAPEPKLHGMDAPYPSSMTGEQVLKTGLSFAQQAKEDGQGANPADRISGTERGAFLLGATLRSHGFEDGNGRTARAVYALSSLEDGGDFNAITKEREDQLSGLN